MKKDNTLTERVAGLASKGLTATEIAVAIGVDVLVVRTLMYRDRRSHGSVCVGVRILDKFYPHAKARNTNVSHLVQRLLKTIIDDNLVGPILDDEVGVECKKNGNRKNDRNRADVRRSCNGSDG